MKLFGLNLTRSSLPAIKEKAVTLGSGILELFDRRGLTDYKTVSSRLIEANTGWVYANVSAIAEEVSKLTPVLYRTKIVKGEIVFDPILTHPILDLLDRFNDFTTASEAFYVISAHIDLAGDTFLLLDGNGANIRNLFILPPDKITLNIGDASDNYRVTSYTYKDTVDGKSVKVDYSAEQIIHIREPNPGNPYRGKSKVEAAAVTIDTDNLAAEWSKQFFRNAAVPNFALSTEQRLSSDDVARFEADIKKNYRGPHNAWKTLILSGGLKPAQLQMTNKDMEFLALQEWTRDKIMATFKNSKTSLGIVEDVNRANAESSMQSWKQNVITPKMCRIVDALNEFLVPRYGKNLVLGFEDPVPENRGEKIEEVVQLRNAAKIITVNEAREMVGLNPDPNPKYNEITQDVQVEPTKVSLPAQLKYVNYKRVLRRSGYIEKAAQEKLTWQLAREKAKQLLKKNGKQVTLPAPRESRHFTNEVVWAYWQKQIEMSRLVEERFHSKVQAFLDNLTNKALANLDQVKSWKKKQVDLFDRNAEVQGAIDLLTPLLEEIGLLAGEQAYQLIDFDASYVITNRLRDYVRRQVAQLAETFIKTDIDKLTSIITQGIESGEGIAVIERRIRNEFTEFTKVQSERITRTEVLRAANAGAIDAFRESGIVEAKQWLTAEDDRVDPVCAGLNGKIIKLSRAFFQDDYLSGLEPPIHPNCRCVVIPVLKDYKRVEAEKLEIVQRELDTNKEYIQELERLLRIS